MDKAPHFYALLSFAPHDSPPQAAAGVAPGGSNLEHARVAELLLDAHAVKDARHVAIVALEEADVSVARGP